MSYDIEGRLKLVCGLCSLSRQGYEDADTILYGVAVCHDHWLALATIASQSGQNASMSQIQLYEEASRRVSATKIKRKEEKKSTAASQKHWYQRFLK